MRHKKLSICEFIYVCAELDYSIYSMKLEKLNMFILVL